MRIDCGSEGSRSQASEEQWVEESGEDLSVRCRKKMRRGFSGKPKDNSLSI